MDGLLEAEDFERFGLRGAANHPNRLGEFIRAIK